MNILWLPHSPWRTPQRARFFAEVLAREHRVHVTDLDGEFRQPRDYLSRRYALNYFPREWQENWVTVHHVPRVSPAIFSRRLRDLNRAWFARHLDRIIQENKIDVVVGTFIAPVPEGVPLVTDLFDDNVAYWETYGTNQAYTAEIAASEEAWVKASETVVTVGSVLADRVRARHPQAQVLPIPNSVDTRLYVPDRAAAREKLGLSPLKKIVGNIGALDLPHEAERVISVARALRDVPDTELLVVGRGQAMPLVQQAVERENLSHVRLLGFASGDNLLKLFQSLDVGLCPYRATPADHARTPMRLLSYSAVGANVVCTELAEVQRMNFPNVTLTPDDDAAFSEAVLAALHRAPERPDAVLDYDEITVTAQYEDVLRRAAGSRA